MSVDTDERDHFQAVLRAWDDYLPYSLHRNNERRSSLYAQPHEHQAMLSRLSTPVPGPPGTPGAYAGFRDKLNEMDDRIRRNADVLSSMAQFCHSFLGIMNTEPSMPPRTEQPTRSVSDRDQDRVRTVLKQMVRDWSQEGAEERKLAYDPIIEAVVSRVPRNRRVLVPGSGLGRLAFELTQRGYACQGNEFSYFMLIPAHFILNCTERIHQHALFPFVHSASNWRSAGDMLRCIHVPDVLPSSLPEEADFSMVAGEFVEVYAKPEEHGAWDVVATCDFMETAKNVLRYLEVINAVLPIGGLWINVGPLLWHFEHDTEPSLELTLEELLALAVECGFEVEERRTLAPQTYTGAPLSMLSHHYVPEFWVCKKVRHHPMAPSI